MLKLKKSAAYLLSVLLILSTVLILPFTVSAAEDEGEAVTAGITGDCFVYVLFKAQKRQSA